MLIILLCISVGLLVWAANNSNQIQYVFEGHHFVEKPEVSLTASTSLSFQEKGSNILKVLQKISQSIKALGNTKLRGISVRCLISNYPLKLIAGETYFARVEGIWSDFPSHSSHLLVSGRHLYQEEINQGARVVEIDEWLSTQMFRTIQVIGKKLTIDGNEYQIVGVFKKNKNFRDKDTFLAYVPLLSIDENILQNYPVCLSIIIPPASGVKGTLYNTLRTLIPNGTFYDIQKEIYRTTLPLRCLLCYIALSGIISYFYLVKGTITSYIRVTKKRLESNYASDLFAYFLKEMLVVLILLGTFICACYYLLVFMVGPFVRFPEWVPVNLVDIKSIKDTIWHNIMMNSGLIIMRTPEVVELSFCLTFQCIICFIAAMMIINPLHLIRQWAKKKEIELAGAMDKKT